MVSIMRVHATCTQISCVKITNETDTRLARALCACDNCKRMHQVLTLLNLCSCVLGEQNLRWGGICWANNAHEIRVQIQRTLCARANSTRVSITLTLLKFFLERFVRIGWSQSLVGNFRELRACTEFVHELHARFACAQIVHSIA